MTHTHTHEQTSRHVGEEMVTLSYVLITPAHNEDRLIEQTIRSVIAQTVLPVKWVIVSDGSTDRTDEIVQKYAESMAWIELVQLPTRKERHFAGKAHAFNVGCEKVRDLNYDVIGNLDADVTFEKGYFEYLLGEMAAQPEVGCAGTHYTEGTFHSFRDSGASIEHVNGQCQMFRRKCLEEIGGYVPSRSGGVDWIAVTTARMKGWKTYSFGDKTFAHHRLMGTGGGGNFYTSRFHYGKKDYFLGGSPIWQLFRASFQALRRPLFIGGLLLLAGYCWAFLTREERPVSKELMKFHRREQMRRLRGLLTFRGRSAKRT